MLLIKLFNFSRNLPVVFFILITFPFASLISGCSLPEDNKEKAEKYYKSGIEAVEQQKYDEAIIHFKNAIQRNDHHAKAHFQLGSLYIKSEQIYLGLRHVKLAIKYDPTLSEAKRMLGLIFYQSRNYEQTIPLFSQIVEGTGAYLEDFLILGNSLSNTGKLEDAKKIFQRATDEYPGDARPKTGMVGVLLLDNRKEEARKLMEKAAAADRDDINIQILLARLYEKIGLFSLAENQLDQILQKFPDDPSSYLASARYYLRSNKLKKSHELLTQASKKGLKNTQILQILAFIEHKQEHFEAALNSLKSAVALAPDDQKSLILLADYYIFLKKYTEARETYEKVINKWPKLLPVKSKIAELLLVERSYDKALEHIEGILKEDPEYAKGHILRGILLRKEGEGEKAREEFAIARDLDPKSAEGAYYYGLTFLDEEKFNISMSEMLRALEKDPDSTKIRLTLAYIYLKTGKLSSALEELGNILQAQPDNIQARILRAVVYLSTKSYEEALADYGYMLQKNPDLPLVRFRVAEIYRAQGKTEDALKVLKELLNSYPDPVKPLEEIVKIYISKNQHQKALDLCNDFLGKNPDNLKAGLIKAAVYLSQKKYDTAENIIYDLHEKNPESDEPFMMMARSRMINKDYEAALKIYQKAIEINPANIDAHMNMARIYQGRGDFEKAAESYETIIRINGSYGPAANDLAYLYTEMDQNLDRALVMATKANELLPENPDAADTLGWVYYKMGSFLLAKKHVNDAISLMQNNPVYHYHLGMILYREQNLEKAAEAFQKAIDLGLKAEELEIAGKLLEDMKATDSLYADIKEEIDRAIKENNLDHALRLAIKARDIIPGNADLADTLGWIYLEKGSVLLAKKHVNEAINLKPDNPLFHYHLGIAYYEEQ
nr:tetratricopeptide repeat protein [Spirochaetota bacterium]HPQ29734.1 tetratricopeptide repeat protein [Desulfobacteraceae bacterium]